MTEHDTADTTGPCETMHAWHVHAALCELLALMFSSPTPELASVMSTGELGESCDETICLSGLGGEGREALSAEVRGLLAPYEGKKPAACLHALRREYTRLFVGTSEPAVTPYAGVWVAGEQGRKGLLFVGEESMMIERTMRRCGFGRAVGAANDPLDHIGSMLGFASLLCLVHGSLLPVPEGGLVKEDEYEQFYREHLAAFGAQTASKVLNRNPEPFERAFARMLEVYANGVFTWPGAQRR